MTPLTPQWGLLALALLAWFVLTLVTKGKGKR